jgi:hypothetical protein
LATEIYINAGFAHVIRKPYSPKILLEIIDSILYNRKSPFPATIEIKDSIVSTKSYSLTSLKSFLSNEVAVLKEFVFSFMTSTQENLSLLQEAISKKNNLKIKEIAHRMTPMFKQIEAYDIVQILNELESKAFSFEEIEVKLNDLKTAIRTLFLLLDKEIN